MKTALDVFCETIGWQGGTIHQAKAEFDKLPAGKRDEICGAMVDQRAAISDLDTVSYFTKRRMELVGLVVRGLGR